MEWDEDLRYRFRGQFLEQGDNKMMLFAFDEPEMIKVEEIVLPPKENTEEDEGESCLSRMTTVVNLAIPWMEPCTRMSKLSFMILGMWNRKQKRNAGAEEKNLKLKQNKKRTKNNIWRFGSGSHLWFKGNFELQVGAF